MMENEEQHRQFQDGLDKLKKYAEEVYSHPETYDGKKIGSLIDEFGDPFVRHLHDEIPTLAPEKLRSIFPDERDLKENDSAMMKWTIKSSNKLTILPWV